LVANAGLSPSQLVYVGVAQGIISLISEVPAGVVADTMSRKWSIVISHVLMGTAMLTTGLVTDFTAILGTQMLWGLSWTFASGADVAWVTDELHQPERIKRVLTKAARAQLSGAVIGIVSVGLLAWTTTLSTAMIVSGVLMFLLGLYVAIAFQETRFVPTHKQRWLASWTIFKNGIGLIRYSRTILLVFAATFFVNGATDTYGRLFPKQLITIGFPASFAPIVWLTGLTIVSMIVGALALRIVEARVHGAGAARHDYLLAVIVGIVGLIVLANAPTITFGIVGVLLVSGLVEPLTRTLATILVNSRTTDKVRATIHSFLAQAEYLGEIACGAVIGLLAHWANLHWAFLGCAALLAITVVLMGRVHEDQAVVEKGTR